MVAAQIEQTLHSLEKEEPNAAAYYLKKVVPSLTRDLLDSEIAFLNENYLRMDSILKHIKVSVNNCDRVRLATLTGLSEHKANNYISSIKSFAQAEKLLTTCSEQNSLRATLDYWKGYVYLEQNELSLSEQSFKNSLSYFSKDSSRFIIKKAHLYFWLGTVKLKQNNLDSALYYLNLSHSIYLNTPFDKVRMLIKIYNNMGAAYKQMWNYNSALLYYQKAIQLNKDKVSDVDELTLACANLGQFYDTFNNYLKSEEWYKQALDWMKSSKLDPRRKALILQNYGTALANNYNYTLALNQYLDALKIIRPYKDTHRDLYVRILLNIISAYNNQDMALNTEEWKAEIEDYFTAHTDKLIEQEIEWKLLKAHALKMKKNYSEALSLLNDLEDEMEKPYKDQYYTILQEKATILKTLGNYIDSRVYYHKLIQHFTSLLTRTDPHTVQLLNEIGSTFVMEGNQKDSSYYYLNMAKANNIIRENSNMAQTLYASKIEWFVSNFYLLMLNIKEFNEEKLSIQDLQQSEGLIYSALSIIESKRIEFRNDQDITNLYRLTRDFFDEAIKYYFALYQHTGNQEYIDKAFFISEKSKYQTLQNAIKLDRVNAFAGVTAKVMQEEQKLGSEMAQLEYQYSQELAKQEEPLPELVQEYITQWLANSNRHNELVDSIKNNLPDYYNLKFNRSTTEINQLQSSILSKSQEMAWVSYYFGYTEAYAIVITHDQKHFLKLDSSDKITRQLKSFNNYVTQQMNDEFHKSSYDVYQLLFKSIDSCLARQAKKIKKVVIIPDGPLNYLNFELLGKPTAKSWHYALYDYQFSYGYSSTLLWTEFSDQLKWKPEALSMIGFAPEFEGYSTSETKQTLRDGSEKPDYDFFGFSPLQKNQDEVKQVAQILSQKKGKTSVYLGSQADESSFKKANLGSFNIIHLATHGFVSGQQQNIAGIAFAKKENSTDDGILYMDEIFSLKNKSNLVCLSACETGSGVFQQGEGLVGLTRAFIYSGAQNLVVSLWKVQDESTSELMTHFYKGLVKSRSVSKSLHDAKITMIKKNPALQPYHWSAFIHVGLN